MAFRCVGSPLEEMKRLEKLREWDPGQVLIFYVVRMFREACATRRLDILQFMLLNGFDLQQSYMRDILHGVIENIDHLQSADTVQPLIRFLLDAGIDVNWQRKSDLYTALHVACCKNLYPIAYLLVLYGADVNAIAADDSMPLACANNIGQTGTLLEEEKTQKALLVSFLIENHAQATWRKQPRRVATENTDTSKSESRPTSKRPTLSFSSSFGIHCSIEDSPDNLSQEGLIFDTSDPPESL
ncbi:Ankyrin repeat domain containing hypothetical protein 44 [Phytophthora palmivora]|uniref:Uncharacterized protein n=1 Tax=Phytophthora palmivora TaxID=4796 RepID=A0A2P4XY36_9STRA|nr:Ankyrin repeat domain containing hypothetical protein 44 [Phytophthora palmivora]